jgi:hypothetical protein
MRAIRYYNGAILDIKERGKKEGLLIAAGVMKGLKTMTNADIAEKLKLTEAEVSEVNDDDLAE